MEIGKSSLALCLLAISVTPFCEAAAPSLGVAARSWNPAVAASYLDQRGSWWAAWPVAARDHDTFCISCHTAVPYMLARPALRAVLGELVPTNAEKTLLSNVTRRVQLWKSVAPFYNDQRDHPDEAARSRSTEAVLNALLLASHDAESGKMTSDTRAAFDYMWLLQRNTGDASGSWLWLQFNNEPWEAHDSEYYGAALAAIAVGTAPENYRSTPDIQHHFKLLRDYFSREYTKQSVINHVVLLWASERWPGLLKPEQQATIVNEVVDKQLADGGWNLASLVWTWRDWSPLSFFKMWRSDASPLAGKTDAYATGLVTFVLEQAGLPSGEAHVRRGMAWLTRNQDKTKGLWRSYSVNGRPDPSSDVGLFMSDAGTAYAVLALTSTK